MTLWQWHVGWWCMVSLILHILDDRHIKLETICVITFKFKISPKATRGPVCFHVLISLSVVYIFGTQHHTCAETNSKYDSEIILKWSLVAFEDVYWTTESWQQHKQWNRFLQFQNTGITILTQMSDVRIVCGGGSEPHKLSTSFFYNHEITGFQLLSARTHTQERITIITHSGCVAPPAPFPALGLECGTGNVQLTLFPSTRAQNKPDPRLSDNPIKTLCQNPASQSTSQSTSQ